MIVLYRNNRRTVYITKYSSNHLYLVLETFGYRIVQFNGEYLLSPSEKELEDFLMNSPLNQINKEGYLQRIKNGRSNKKNQ